MSHAPRQHGFAKCERLCSRTRIDEVYHTGQRLHAYPFTLLFVQAPATGAATPPCQTLVSAPKRRFRHAVQRNSLKRLMRECFRLSKMPLYDHLQASGMHLDLAIIYSGDPIPFGKLLPKMQGALAKLVAQLEATPQQPTPIPTTL